MFRSALKTLCLSGLFLGSVWPGSAASEDLPLQCLNIPAKTHVETTQHDALAQLLRSSCPGHVQALRALIPEAQRHTTMVANRGYHNPGEGSFSFFESARGSLSDVNFKLKPGQLMWGHFTANIKGQISLLQTPKKGALMVEVIAWDPHKQLYNFYELIGNGSTGEWFFRGDSADILADKVLLHRQRQPTQKPFGQRLRCSGCHLAGGPIMKELAPPHNAWWRKERPLPLGGAALHPEVAEIMGALKDASQLALEVKTGMGYLLGSEVYQNAAAAKGLQAQLRPLFCAEEINFESDQQLLSQTGAEIDIPGGFFVDPLLYPVPQQKMKTQAYQQELIRRASRFPETAEIDASHAWLTPVKAWSDQQQVKGLLESRLIDEKFVSDVLAVDFQEPVFSQARCQLLQYIPQKASVQWRQELIQNLEFAQQNKYPNPSVQALLNHLKSSNVNHKLQIQAYAQKNRALLQQEKGQQLLMERLNQRRLAIAQSEISQNPRGQILEPGFRVLFPHFPLSPDFH